MSTLSSQDRDDSLSSCFPKSQESPDLFETGRRWAPQEHMSPEDRGESPSLQTTSQRSLGPILDSDETQRTPSYEWPRYTQDQLEGPAPPPTVPNDLLLPTETLTRDPPGALSLRSHQDDPDSHLSLLEPQERVQRRPARDVPLPTLVGQHRNCRPFPRRRTPKERPSTRASARIAEKSALQRGFEQGLASSQSNAKGASIPKPVPSKKRKVALPDEAEAVDRGPMGGRGNDVAEPGERVNSKRPRSAVARRSGPTRRKSAIVVLKIPRGRTEFGGTRPVDQGTLSSANAAGGGASAGDITGLIIAQLKEALTPVAAALQQAIDQL
ncbi:MAG: hypothetical protein M1837_005489 [Sclerophora amabilis]|nr:MAG: hypothetical protein M1837_005489 [Sclerophora amabilis]